MVGMSKEVAHMAVRTSSLCRLLLEDPQVCGRLPVRLRFRSSASSRREGNAPFADQSSGNVP